MSKIVIVIGVVVRKELIPIVSDTSRHVKHLFPSLLSLLTLRSLDRFSSHSPPAWRPQLRKSLEGPVQNLATSPSSLLESLHFSP